MIFLNRHFRDNLRTEKELLKKFVKDVFGIEYVDEPKKKSLI